MPVDSVTTPPPDAFSASPAASLVAEVGSQARNVAPLEEVFADLCLLAGRLLDVPAAVISLRDVDRVLPVGAFGIRDVLLSWGSSPLSISLSGHTPAEGEALAISDVRSHELLAEDPLHTKAGFLSFLAVSLPIEGEEDVSGTLCALSREARPWSSEDVESLSLVAGAVATEIRLRGSMLRIRGLEKESRSEAATWDEPSALEEVLATPTEEERSARRVLESAQQPFVALDEDGVVLEWNRAAEKTFGWSRLEAIGKELAAFFVAERYREALRGLHRSPENPPAEKRVELDALRSDGKELPVELSVSAVEEEGSWSFNAFLTDLSERRRTERDRLRRERLLSYAQRVARMGSWEWDIDRGEVLWSAELHRVFGTDPGTFHPTVDSYLDGLPPTDRDLAQALMSHALDTGEEFALEHRVNRQDGSQRVVLGQGRVERDPDGKPIRMFGTAQDITETRELEARSRELVIERGARVEAQAAEEQIKTMLVSITDALLHVDRRGRLLFVNPEGERLLQRSAASMVGEPFSELLGSAWSEELERALATGRPVELEEYYEPRDAWLEVRAFPSERGLSIYIHDITDRRATELKLRASEASYRFLSDAIPQQIWTAHPEGRLEYVNEVVIDYLGVPREAAVDQTWDGWIHFQDVQEWRRRWHACRDSGDDFEMELRLLDGQGAYRWHLVRAKAQKHPDGTVSRWYGSNTNVHDLKELERARDKALEDLERVTHLLSSERTTLEEQAKELRKFALALQRSNRELDQFAYVASHDLKAPLRGIANLADWLSEDLEGRLDDRTRGYLRLLDGRVHRMESLIDGILQYARAGRARATPESVDVGRLVHDVVDMLAPPARFTIDVQGYMPVLVTERSPLEQVFLNLLGNAVKHADNDAPVVTVSVTDEGGGWYEFSVSDNGPGIAPEYHERIFSIFQTLRAKDDVESTGIGLSVVKRIVEWQGGQVWVESDVGQGAAFRFLWPDSPRDAKEAAAWRSTR